MQGSWNISFRTNLSNFLSGVTVVGRLALFEAVIAAVFGIACLLGRSPLHANKPRAALICLETLRRSRWQSFSMFVVMFLLRMQHVFPASVELVVGVQFLIFIVLAFRGLPSKTRRAISTSASDFIAV